MPKTEDIKAFLRASDRGDLALMRGMLEGQPELVSVHHPESGRRPIHMAIRAGHYECVKLLFEYGAEPVGAVYPIREATDPLTMAEDRGMKTIVELVQAELQLQSGMTEPVRELCDTIASEQFDAAAELIEQDPECLVGADKHGNTVLHVAVAKRSFSLVQLILLRMKDIIDVDLRNRDGLRPLQIALGKGENNGIDTAIAGALIQAGAKYTLWCAAELGDLRSVRRMIETDGISANENESGPFSPRSKWLPLVRAVCFGHREIVSYLLDAGADIDAVVITHDQDDHLGNPTGYVEEGLPLLCAIENNHFEIAHLLLDRGARSDTQCVYAGNGVADVAMECLDTRLRNRVLLNGGRPLLYTLVSRQEYPALIELLKPSRGWKKHHNLAAGAEENLKLILSWAIYFGDGALVKLCLSFKPLLVDSEWAAHMLQLMRGQAGTVDNRVEVLTALLEYGVNPNAQYREGATMLHMVQGCNDLHRSPAKHQIAMIDCLLDFGADINRIDEELKATPLGWRCRYGDTEVVKHLLERGADPELAGADWARPLEWARKKGHHEIVAIIRQALQTAK
jgi:ankyrin repeat protein